MASSSRMALRRLPQACSAATAPLRISRGCLLRIPTPSSSSSLRAFSQYSRTTNTLLLASERKPNNLFAASTYPSILQSRSYADIIVKVPQMAESISEGTLKQWQKKVGDYVAADEEIATIETDKIDVAVNATEAGTITEILAQEEDTVTVGQDLCKIEAGGAAPKGGEKKETTAGETPKEPAAPERQAERKPDSEKQANAQSEKTQAKPPPSPPPSPKPAQPAHTSSSSKASEPYDNRVERRVKMSRMRIRIAERLKESQNTAAFVTTFQEVDMSAVMEMRQLYKEDVFHRSGVKLGFMSFFCRASVLAMKEIPTVNAAIEGPPDELTTVFRDYVDISIAVATPKGLVTPIVRNVESMGLIDIDRKIAELGEKARASKLTIEDLAGGTFTISNGGVFGNLMGTPIINLPHSAVLGLHAVKDRPIAIKGQVVIRPMMYLALTYDHRLLDGREAVTFLLRVKEYIEDPRRMLLEFTPADE